MVDENSTVTSWLLAHGASPNKTCELDKTPLGIALQYAPMETILKLFEYGGSIKYGQPLHAAVRRELPDYLAVLQLVLDKVPPETINHVEFESDLESYYWQRMFGLGTPLQAAAEQGKVDVARILIERGAHPLIRNTRGKIPLERAERVGHSAMVDYLKPLTKSASPPEYQYIDDKQCTGAG
jgi:ankyrin repeat protein